MEMRKMGMRKAVIKEDGRGRRDKGVRMRKME
jgi:hypothetical protein